MPLGVATPELLAKQRPQTQDRKDKTTMITLLNPEGKEVQVSLANAQDLINNVKGWRRPQVPAELQNPYAHAPRRTRPALVDTTGATPQKNVTPDPDALEPGGRDRAQIMVQAAEQARAKLERDNAPTADQVDEHDLEAMAKSVEDELLQTGVVLPKANEAHTLTRKQRTAAKAKSKEDDAEVVSRVAVSAAEEADLAAKAEAGL